MKIAEKFAELKKRKQAALIGFITAGDPSMEDTVRIAEVLIKNGVDILELGLPFSDPIADGPVIQKAGERAFLAGMNTDRYFETAKKISGVPKACMTYYNLVLHRGLDRFAKDCIEADITGLIIPDLPIEEAEPLDKVCRKHGIDLIYFAAPTTTPERLEKTLKAAKGFLYLASVAGVTGARKDLPEELTNLIKQVKKEAGSLPVAVGFGISRPEQIKEIILAGADAVIVGSAFIKIIDESCKERGRMLSRLGDYAAELKEAAK